MPRTPKMKLRKICGAYQFVVERPEDLELAAALDEAHWVATSIPTDGLICDDRFAKLIDSDKNGRIRVEEFRQSQKWLFRVLSDRTRLAMNSPVVRLDALNRSDPDGERLFRVVKRVLTNLREPDGEEITLAQVRNVQQILADAGANGDGVIPPECVREDDLKQFIVDVMAVMGPVQDVGGGKGVNRDKLDAFLKEARAYLDWAAKAQAKPAGAPGAIMVWGDKTPVAYEAFTRIEAKTDEYFHLCAVARFTGYTPDRPAVPGPPGPPGSMVPRPPDPFRPPEPVSPEERLRAAPIAQVRPDPKMPLGQEVNPYYRDAVDAFINQVLVHAAKDRDGCLSEAEWRSIKAALKPYRDWLAAIKGAATQPLGADKLKAYVEGPLPERLRALIVEDEAVANQIRDLENIEKLLLCHQYLFELANNLINLTRLYDPTTLAFIEAGTLVMDGRRFTLNVRVTDRAIHKAVAEQSGICVMYLEVTSGTDKERFEAATAVTAGEAGTLRVGKRGVFTTHTGREWDARVVDILLRPISMVEAFKAPFIRLGEMLQKQLDRFGASRYADVEKSLSDQVGAAETVIKQATPVMPGVVPAPVPGTPPVAVPGTPLVPVPAPAVAAATPAAAPRPPAPVAPTPAAAAEGRSRAFRDLMVGGGVATAAVGALGTSFAFVAKVFASIKPVHLIAVLVSLIVIMLAPTLIITYLRLRARSLTVFLEACGWAMNANIRLSGRLGRVFTHRPDLPYGAKRVSLGRLLVTWGVPAMLVLVAGYSIGVGVGRLLHLW